MHSSCHIRQGKNAETIHFRRQIDIFLQQWQRGLFYQQWPIFVENRFNALVWCTASEASTTAGLRRSSANSSSRPSSQSESVASYLANFSSGENEHFLGTFVDIKVITCTMMKHVTTSETTVSSNYAIVLRRFSGHNELFFSSHCTKRKCALSCALSRIYSTQEHN